MDLLTVQEAAQELGVAESTILHRIQHAGMKHERVGARGLLIPRREVERWHALGKLKPGPKPRKKLSREPRP